MSSTASAAGFWTGVAPSMGSRLPAYYVAVSYLNLTDGPIWVARRSSGYAYRCSFSRNSSRGLASLKFGKCSNIYKAYCAARDAVYALAIGATPIDQFTLEGAKSMLWYDQADRQQTAKAAAENKVLDQILGAIKDPIAFPKKAQSVTADEVRAAMNDLVLPALMPETCNMVVTCSMKDVTVSATGPPILSYLTFHLALSQQFQQAGFGVRVETFDQLEQQYVPSL
jgi:Zn-dependent M16 (insulinase) family peptidase